jgi:hypothetical protein
MPDDLLNHFDDPLVAADGPSESASSVLVSLLRGHLADALGVLVQMQHQGHPTMDWQRRLQRLMSDVEGGWGESRGGSRSPVALVPVGPMVELGTWIQETIMALQEFANQYRVAAEEDPEHFPLDRTAADWMSEFQGRAT